MFQNHFYFECNCWNEFLLIYIVTFFDLIVEQKGRKFDFNLKTFSLKAFWKVFLLFDTFCCVVGRV